MIIHDVIQSSPEWSALRAGIPCSSQFHRILTLSGKKSDQRDGYMNALLAERVLGRPLEPFKTLPMQQGSMSEEYAVSYFEFQTDLTTERVGFITNDSETWGSSPDRFVSDNSLLEIKCPEPDTHMGLLRHSGKVYDKYKCQCAGQLWICERARVYVMSYCPGFPESLIHVDRDEKFISLLAEAVQEFSNDLEQAWAQIVEDGWATKASKQPKRSTQEELMRAMRDSLIAIQR